METLHVAGERNWDEAERRSHGQQVQERFKRERQDKFRKIQDTIQVMHEQGVTISQNEVARAAGVSVGFINKHLRDVVEAAKRRQQNSAGTLHTVRQLTAETKELERMKLMNQRLKDKITEQRRANQELLAQVARVVDLEDEVERLRTQNRELLATLKVSQTKVAPLRVQRTQTQLEAALERTGIKLSLILLQEIDQHSSETVLKAVEAFEQYREEQTVQKPAACLLRAIQEEWEQNVAQVAITPLEHEFEQSEAVAIPTQHLAKKPASKFLGQNSDAEPLKVKNGDLKAQLMGMELLEKENEELLKQNQRLMRLLTQAQAVERTNAAADFTKARVIAQAQPSIPDVEF